MLNLYSLAEKLGIWDVHSLAWEMSLPQYVEWCEYFAHREEQMEKSKARRDELQKARRGAGVQKSSLI